MTLSKSYLILFSVLTLGLSGCSVKYSFTGTNINYELVKTFSIENFYNDKVLKDEVAIMPIDGNNYYIGATHEQHFTVTEITDKGKAELEEKLRCILNSPYQITAHQVAVRPATKHRRPFVGMHPQHSNVGILNGLGTKGVSLAPYFAQQLVRHLLYGEAISAEVDIAKHLF